MSSRNHKPRNVTIVDVAREANVSYSTVSRVLNNVSYVKADKRQRVLEAIERLGYIANVPARGLVGGRTQLIGMIVHDLVVSYIEEIVRGIDEELASTDYNLILFTTHRQPTKEIRYVRMMTQGLVDGMLLLLPLSPDSYTRSLAEEHFPYVVIDHHGFDDFSLTVTATNWQGAFDATTYLIGLGHRRIGFIAGNPALSSAGERLEGYKAALAAYDIPFQAELVETGYFRYANGLQAAQTLLALEQPPTAIFATNDHSALGAIEAIRSRGLSIPEDISVIGFDDVPEAQHLIPSLTTVRQPLGQMGQVAVKMLLQQIKDQSPPPQRVTLATQLVIRDSCGPYQSGRREHPKDAK